MATPIGLNVWYDLMTTDVEGAQRFYTEVLGWKTERWKDAAPGTPPYTMWVAEKGALGGVMALPDEARQAGAPPHWLAYTTVANVDETVAQAKRLGATICSPPFDIPNVGRLAVLNDPQGATFAVFSSSNAMEAPPDAPGQFSWAELNTTDYESAWKFYSTLFGWKERERFDMGEMGIYFMFHDPSGKTKGGMSNVAKAMNMPPHWLHYVTVANIDAALDRIRARGGKVLNGPMPVPGGDVIAQCMDPQGAAFAIFAKGSK